MLFGNKKSIEIGDFKDILYFRIVLLLDLYKISNPNKGF